METEGEESLLNLFASMNLSGCNNSLVVEFSTMDLNRKNPSQQKKWKEDQQEKLLKGQTVAEDHSCSKKSVTPTRAAKTFHVAFIRPIGWRPTFKVFE